MTSEEEKLMKDWMSEVTRTAAYSAALYAAKPVAAILLYCSTHCPRHKEGICSSGCPLFEYKKLMEKNK